MKLTIKFPWRVESPDFPLVFAVPIGIIVTMKAHFQSGRLSEWPSRLKSEFLSGSHFTPISLKNAFNADRRHLNGSLKPVDEEVLPFGLAPFQGIPFELGLPEQPNLILLDNDEIVIDVGEARATYILFLHAVEDRRVGYAEGLEDFAGTVLMDAQGNELGDLVSQYSLEYSDGTRFTEPILRRFAIQQSRITWGASPFSAVTASRPEVFPTTTDEQILGRVPQEPYGRGETRQHSPRDLGKDLAWIYALPNPNPDKPISKIICTPKGERSLIYAISHTLLDDHPLRPGLRRKLKFTLPKGARFNALGELEEVEIDLGQVISARAAFKYDHSRWSGSETDVQPVRANDVAIVEYIAHPKARLYVSTDPADGSFKVYELADGPQRILVEISPARRPVRIRVVEKGSGHPVPVRLHVHGEEGEYLPPRNHHRKVNVYWFEDNYAEFANGLNQYSYIPGECEVDLPLGQVYIEISRGYEIEPLRTDFVVSSDTDEITFELERVLQWRAKGWVTADTHVHFLSPQTALLEGSAEGVNVVNLLASQWGEMFSNVGDFDGRSTLGAEEFGGDGEFFVRVGTENRMQVLGHISLLGYSGAMIQPLCSGGPSESAIGDPVSVTMAEWAQRCIDQNGLVVMPHAPNPQCERAADIVLGLVHAVEMMTFNPFDSQISPYGIADWYRYLNLGYHVPIVGGSDKMSAASLLGGVRTYTHLGDRPFTYENWMAAVRAGNTFVTVGPLAEVKVEGLSPGSILDLPPTGGSINVSWRVESVSLPIDRVEVVMGGLTEEQVIVEKKLSSTGSVELNITESTWIALRVRGSYQGRHGEIAAHTSAVQVRVGAKRLFSKVDAFAVLEQIEGAIAYVDTIAPRPKAQRYKQLRATLESAYNRLHQQMHRNGIYHDHAPLHDHAEHHEE